MKYLAAVKPIRQLEVISIDLPSRLGEDVERGAPRIVHLELGVVQGIQARRGRVAARRHVDGGRDHLKHDGSGLRLGGGVVDVDCRDGLVVADLVERTIDDECAHVRTSLEEERRKDVPRRQP